MAEMDPKIASDFANAINEMAKAFSEMKKPVEEFGRGFGGATNSAKDMVNLLG